MIEEFKAELDAAEKVYGVSVLTNIPEEQAEMLPRWEARLIRMVGNRGYSFVKSCEELGVPPKEGLLGCTIPARKLVMVRADLPPAERLYGLVHEIGHMLDFEINGIPKVNRSEKMVTDVIGLMHPAYIFMETKAELTNHIVRKTLGLESRAAQYLKLYDANKMYVDKANGFALEASRQILSVLSQSERMAA